tara:strand:+ start:38491 stop:40605 length:2115 start_codon:yes stop_codon:yes gene_type:complete
MIPSPDISQVYPKTGLALDSRFVVGEGNARDLSSDANTGTLVTGRALALDGTGDYLSLGSPSDLDGIFASGGTLSTWLKVDNYANFDRIFDTTVGTFAYLTSGGGLVFQAKWDSTLGIWTFNDMGIAAGNWFHFALVYDGSATANDPILYINGVASSLDSTQRPVGTKNAETGNKFLFADSSGTSPYHGSASCVKYFNVNLTAAQALEQYNNPEQALPTGVSASALKLYLPLTDYQITGANSLNGLYVMDASGRNNHALANNCGMELAQQPPCPQLGLMPSTSRRFFDGANDHYTGGNGLDQSSGLAVSAWVIPFSDAGQCVIETANDGNSRTGIVIPSSGKAQFQHFAGSGYFGKADDGGVSYAGKLTHIVGCYDGSGYSTSTMKLYVNGSEKTSTSLTGFGTQGSDSTAIGARFVAGGSPGGFFDGYIVSIAVWGDDLSASEVTALYDGGPEFDPLSDSGNYASSGDLSHYWKLDNAFTVQDLKGSKNLTRVGGTEMTTIPEGITAGITVLGSTQEKRADNAVINLNGKELVTIPHDVNLNPDVSEGFTVSVWAKMRNLGNGSSTPILDKDEVNDRWYLRIRDDASDAIQFNFGDGSGSTDVGQGNLTDNDWHHYVFVLNTSESAWTTARMYLDGVHNASADKDISARSGDTPGTDPLTIGSTGTTAQWDGAIAYPRVYARSLSENEVKLLYTSGFRVVGGL